MEWNICQFKCQWFLNRSIQNWNNLRNEWWERIRRRQKQKLKCDALVVRSMLSHFNKKLWHINMRLFRWHISLPQSMKRSVQALFLSLSLSLPLPCSRFSYSLYISLFFALYLLILAKNWGITCSALHKQCFWQLFRLFFSFLFLLFSLLLSFAVISLSFKTITYIFILFLRLYVACAVPYRRQVKVSMFLKITMQWKLIRVLLFSQAKFSQNHDEIGYGRLTMDF